jgi:hypothetical protein
MSALNALQKFIQNIVDPAPLNFHLHLNDNFNTFSDFIFPAIGSNVHLLTPLAPHLKLKNHFHVANR